MKLTLNKEQLEWMELWTRDYLMRDARDATTALVHVKIAVDNIRELRAALGAVLDCIDYTSGACRPTEQVGAVIAVEVLELAKRALKG